MCQRVLRVRRSRATASERATWLDYRFTTYQDARRVRLVDGLIFETNILRVSPVNG